MVGARPVQQKKGADKGIDGRIYFQDTDTRLILLSVKAGHTGPNHVSELLGVMQNNDAVIGALLTMQEPTKAMRQAAAAAGFYTSPWGKHPRLQLLTVVDMLAGKRVDFPAWQQTNVTFKKAPKAKEKGSENQKMDFDTL